jgi:hypothetical protein
MKCLFKNLAKSGFLENREDYGQITLRQLLKGYIVRMGEGWI